MKILRSISFSLMGVIILLLIAGSVTEQLCGTAVAVKYVYTAPWTVVLWAAAAGCAIAYMLSVRIYRHVITCLMHFSFVVILGGALVTHLFGEKGTLSLRADGTQAQATDITLPFNVQLLDFHVEYYPGTNAPMDFVSEIEADGVSGQVSMNHIFTYRHYRFYQAMYDTDMQGVTLRVSHDPWGISITYIGYALLLISMILFFFQKRTYFRQLLTKMRNGNYKALMLLLLLLPLTTLSAKTTTPPTLYRPTAEAFCNLYVYYGDRVCPMSTLAKDFTVKLYGKPSYKGLSSEQVLCGWLFYYDQWAKEPCIKIKGTETRRILGIDGKYACLNDYTGRGIYKLEDVIREHDKNAIAADEKFQLVSMVCTATLLRIYPLSTPDINWYSWIDALPTDIPFEDWQFVKGSMEYVALQVAQNKNAEAQDALGKIRDWQQKKAGNENLPSNARFKAEQAYNHFNITRPLAMGCATVGLLLFFICCLLLAQGKRLNPWVNYTFIVLMAIIFLLLTTVLCLRWIASGHVPLSNGHETMLFLAWLAALLTSVISLRDIRLSMSADRQTANALILPFGYLICGMTLMVSMMSASNPQITNLMPVLQSPLLTLHVAIIMIAYCLLAFVTLNGIAAFFLKDSREQLQALSQILLYPAVFCLTIGIFIGAVWANISWGSYWQWDPKEVWALITMLVYSALLHTGSLSFLKKPLAFHIYSVVAFLFVLFTYFGVNFLLGGMHSYA